MKSFLSVLYFVAMFFTGVQVLAFIHKGTYTVSFDPWLLAIAAVFSIGIGVVIEVLK